MKQRIAHVGLGKAGSTTLQRYVFNNFHGQYYSSDTKLPKWLKFIYFQSEQSEVLVSMSKMPKSFKSYIRKSYFDYKKINEKIDPNSDFLISSEGLVGNSFSPRMNSYENAFILKRHLKINKVIIVLRRHVDYINSLFLQMKKDMRLPTHLELDEYFGSNASMISEADMLYKPVVLDYYDLFGIDNVAVVPFDILFCKGEFKKILQNKNIRMNVSSIENAPNARKTLQKIERINPEFKLFQQDTKWLSKVTGISTFNDWYL